MSVFIDDHKTRFGVEPICRALQIAPSTYYAVKARQRDPSARSLRDAELLVEIRRVYEQSRGLYGARKVWWQPRLDGIAREDMDPISRRGLLGTGAKGVGAALGLSAPFAAAAPASARDIDPDLVPHWMRLMSLLSRHDAMCGPHDVLDTAQHELGVIAQHRHIAKGALRADLLRVESRWSEFVSWLSQDTGNEHVAAYWTDRAARPRGRLPRPRRLGTHAGEQMGGDAR